MINNNLQTPSYIKFKVKGIYNDSTVLILNYSIEVPIWSWTEGEYSNKNKLREQ